MILSEAQWLEHVTGVPMVMGFTPAGDSDDFFVPDAHDNISSIFLVHNMFTFCSIINLNNRTFNMIVNILSSP